MSKKEKVEEKPRFYKGYEIRWLVQEDQINHPHRNLVEEYINKYGKVE